MTSDGSDVVAPAKFADFTLAADKKWQIGLICLK